MDTYEKLANLLRELKNETIIALSGAGLSAESGIPTFRGKDGLWNKYNPTELATFEAFNESPLKVWQWYLWRMFKIAKAKPNPAHYALVEMEKLFPNFWHITQNVDGLHRIAGQRKFLELHGHIWDGKCRYCGAFYPYEDLKKIFPYADRDYLAKLSEEQFRKEILEGLTYEKLPKCKICGGIVGPGVVWFGENLPQNVLDKSFALAREAKLCFTVGTSAVVYPAAYIPELCKKTGGILVEINLEETPLTPYADFIFRDSAAKALPKIVSLLKRP
jgi:NAD-dependent deacetylase